MRSEHKAPRQRRKKRQRVGSASTQPASISSHSYEPYQALPPHHIRVLCLEPGPWDSPLRASFDVVSLDPKLAAKDGHGDHEGYEAISYVWGEPVFQHEIRIGDSDVKLHLTTSLYNALRHFRRTDSTHRLWADALCINQANDLEKGVQVAMMAQIYQQASRTLIWLGLTCQTDTLAFAAGNIYSDNPRFETLDLTSPEGVDTAIKWLDDKLSETARCSCCPTFSTCEQKSITMQALLSAAEFTTRPWFTRLWVLQEVQLLNDVEGKALKTIVCCGPYRMCFQSLPWLTNVFGVVARSAERLPLLSVSITRVQEVQACTLRLSQHCYQSFVIQTFWLAYSTFMDRHCSDARDRVFALRTCMQIDHPSLQPDYTITCAEVFRRLVCVFMDVKYVTTRTRHLRSFDGKGDDFEGNEHDILDWEFMPWAPLAFVGTEARNGYFAHGPSWVPDLHHLTEQTRSKALLYTRDFRKHLTQFRADYDKFEWRLDGHSDEILEVRGRVCGRVGSILPESSWPRTNDIKPTDFATHALPMIVSWYERCLAFARQGSCSQMVVEANDFHDLLFGRLYCRHVDMTDSVVTAVRSIADYVSLQQFLERYWPDTRSADEIETLSRELLFLISLIDARDVNPGMRPLPELDRYRRLCHIFHDNGNIGLGWVPQSAEPGDRICIIKGAPYPFVIRSAGEGKYRLIGDAYTHQETLKNMLGCDCRESRGPNNDPVSMRWSAQSPEPLGMTTLDLRNLYETMSDVEAIYGESSSGDEASEQDSENENGSSDEGSASDAGIDRDMQRLIDNLGWITLL
ncbi:hypothetical protein CKM354_000906900 [Cercospora kikuchii]|uniref:Heterokaryon incompatibility domain-containing protein n=1 Tax=Cercospora kikuchii TaxID=84275 RepID=A0A9P3CNC5_9PEZI|nr:uncharacterized protein CKM354_000906900 [Cercospora kikuchii]GIZ45923.1 hypothetical protein CKM354_000906900 [Cercospora kikuchii]